LRFAFYTGIFASEFLIWYAFFSSIFFAIRLAGQPGAEHWLSAAAPAGLCCRHARGHSGRHGCFLAY
jgi:hypothetical protein